jgi:Flp pilus assembly protein TadD
VEIPLEEFDKNLLPEQARDTSSEAFQAAVVAFFQCELQQAAKWIQVSVDEHVIRVGWRKNASIDPLQMAVERLKTGDYARGVQMLRLALRLKPNDAKVRYNLGMALSDLGQLDEALAHLRQAAEVVPDVADIQVALGVALYRKGLFDEARPALEKAVQLEPDNPYALRNLAGCLLRLNEPPSRAEEMLRQATKLLPDDQQAWIGLGQALEVQAKLKDADEAYLRAIGINPHNQLAGVAKSGRSKIAQKTMREAVGGDLRMDAVMYCLGALQKCAQMSQAEVQKVGFEIATLGTKGINPNDSDRKYKLRTLPGDFTGLQLLCYMFVTWKKIAPHVDMGFDLSNEYSAALDLFKSQPQ